MTWLGLRSLAKRLRGRWHGHLHQQILAQTNALSDISEKLERLERRLTATALELESVEQLLSRRLAEQMSDLQDHLQLNAASIVAQVSERATQATGAAEIRRFSRGHPGSDRAA